MPNAASHNRDRRRSKRAANGIDARQSRTGHKRGGRIQWHRLVHRRLLVRVVLPYAIGLVLLVLAVTDLVRGQVPAAVLLWLVPGIAIGFPIGRMTKVAWDSEKSQVVQDGAGMLLLLGYIAVRLGVGYVLNPRILDWPYVTNAAALVGVGLLFGRWHGTIRSIRYALEAPADQS